MDKEKFKTTIRLLCGFIICLLDGIRDFFGDSSNPNLNPNPIPPLPYDQISSTFKKFQGMVHDPNISQFLNESSHLSPPYTSQPSIHTISPIIPP